MDFHAESEDTALRVKNRVLESLLELQAEGARNGSFDRLLFLNDVISTVRPPPIRQICWL